MTPTSLDENIVRYIISKLQCTHPFYISRILFIAESKALDTTGKRLTSLTYKGASFGFYIEELPSLIEELEKRGCIERHEEKGCIKYTCEEPDIPQEIKRVLDEAIESTATLSPRELNRLTVNNPHYKELVEKA